VVTAEEFGDSLGATDTVGTMWAGNFSYGGAFSAHRRWAGFADQYGPRVFCSDTFRVWREISMPGSRDVAGIDMYALDDTTALIAWGDFPVGLRWGTLRGRTFEEGPRPPGLEPYFSAVPVFCRRPSGGVWIGWVTKQNHVSIGTIRDGAWYDRDSITCAYDPPGLYLTDGAVELTREKEEYPVIGWDASFSGDYRQVYCIARPAPGGGFLPGEQLPTSEDATPPHLTRDRNGDIWVAWYTEDIQGMFWIHSYTTAISTTPTLGGPRSTPLLSWRLSEAASESWWAVLRATGDGPFESVARVQAGEGTLMSWPDTGAPRGQRLRYRVRRESMDQRYEWTSEEATWPPRGPVLSIGPHGPHPALDRAELAIVGARAGPLDVRVLDIQGREVWRVDSEASGSGQDLVTLEFAAAPRPLRSGLYLVRVADAGGQVAPIFKLVVLR